MYLAPADGPTHASARSLLQRYLTQYLPHNKGFLIASNAEANASYLLWRRFVHAPSRPHALAIACRNWQSEPQKPQL